MTVATQEVGRTMLLIQIVVKRRIVVVPPYYRVQSIRAQVWSAVATALATVGQVFVSALMGSQAMQP